MAAGNKMAYVSVPKDLTRVKNKVVFNMTRRQIICFSIAGVIGFPFYFLTRNLIGNGNAMMGMVLLMVPAFLFAMYEKDGQPAEKLLKNRLRFMLWPRERPYKTHNIYKSEKKEELMIGKKQAAVSSGKKVRAGSKAVKKAPRRG